MTRTLIFRDVSYSPNRHAHLTDSSLCLFDFHWHTSLEAADTTFDKLSIISEGPNRSTKHGLDPIFAVAEDRPPPRDTIGAGKERLDLQALHDWGWTRLLGIFGILEHEPGKG
jgi:hypothetical protein